MISEPSVGNKPIPSPWLWLLMLCLLLPMPALAATRALLIGVGRYPNLPASLQLQGPANDVQAFERLLTSRGIAARQITVLADGPGTALPPTRANILAALSQMAATANAGDRAILYFAGHGAQQPSQRVEEPDGLDEVFLPQDIGLWDGRVAAVPNAITDNEIDSALQALTAKGALTWAIFDTCHAGSMTRGETGNERVRGLNPVQLGMPPRAPRKNADTLGPQLGVVGFFAAGPDERAPELELPLGAQRNEVRGLFSFNLQQALLALPADASFETVLAEVSVRYRKAGRVRPNPQLRAPEQLLQAVALPQQ